MIRKLPLLFVLFIVFSTAASHGRAESDARELMAPENTEQGIEHLLMVAHPRRNAPLNPKALKEVMEFFLSPKADTTGYYAEKREGINSAYFEFELNTDLGRILRYAFNPSIPSQAFRPSSVRYSSWSEIDGEKQGLAGLPSRMADLSEPVIVRGIEDEVITPDTNTGGYYGYSLDKTLILMKHEGHNVFISLTKQKGRSSIGKKGAVMGSDEDWNYFYSGEDGLSKTGLGWVDSYIYNSIAISIYYEVDADRPLVKCGIFKWLGAGWAGLNVVTGGPIRTGLNRYARDLKTMIENPDLPEPDVLTNKFSALKRLPLEELKLRYSPYLAHIRDKAEKAGTLSRRSYLEMLKNGAYLARMNRDEVEGALVLEEMKCIVKKGCNNPDFRAAIINEKTGLTGR